MMRWASKNASKTKVESSTQTVEDDGSVSCHHSCYTLLSLTDSSHIRFTRSQYIFHTLIMSLLAGSVPVSCLLRAQALKLSLSTMTSSAPSRGYRSVWAALAG